MTQNIHSPLMHLAADTLAQQGDSIISRVHARKVLHESNLILSEGIIAYAIRAYENKYDRKLPMRYKRPAPPPIQYDDNGFPIRRRRAN